MISALIWAGIALGAPFLEYEDTFDTYLTTRLSGTGGWQAQWSGDAWNAALGTVGPATNTLGAGGFGSTNAPDNHLIQSVRTFTVHDTTLRFSTTDNDTVGFTFGFQDTRNFYLVFVSCGCDGNPNNNAGPALDGSSAAVTAGVRLYRVVNGTAVQVGERLGPTFQRAGTLYIPPRWAWLRVRQDAGGRIRVWFDPANEVSTNTTLMFDITDTTFPSGRIGLYSYSSDVRFDWIRVHLDDTDSDGVPDLRDNCPLVANFNQANLDNDPLGDVCDPDEDGDGSPKPADCNDRDAAIRTGQPELCDGVDNDCSGGIDDNPTGPGALTSYPDADADGHGASGPALVECGLTGGRTLTPGDCDDADPARHPGRTEVCDDKDNDCNGQIDDNPSDPTRYYADTDADGHGDAEVSALACALPAGFVANATDCDDTRAEAHPGADERCNGLDDDCDSTVDEDPIDPTTGWPDADADGFGAGAPLSTCDPSLTLADNDLDCDDGDPDVYPGAPELPDDGVDQDCDGADRLGDDEEPGEGPRPYDPLDADTAAAALPDGCGCRAAPAGAPRWAWIVIIMGTLIIRNRRV